MIYVIDIDGTICTNTNGNYKNAIPLHDRIEHINHLYDDGNTIYIYTARGMKTFDGDIKVIYEQLYELTLNHLKEWGVKHHGLFMGKLHYDLLIDDKAMDLETAKRELIKL